MRRVHPNLRLAAPIAALAVLSGAAGCKNQQTPGLANPFLAPNRVPPPSTRALLPGQAQPYYQGDPLPVTQNGVSASNGVSLASSEAEMPSAEGNLAWTSPRATASMPTTVPTRPANPVSSPQRSPVVASHEPTVTIPDDGNSLRFAFPQPELAEPRPFTPNSPVALASQMPLATQPQLQPSPTSRDIAQAAYTEPVITNSQTPAPTPWRSPQISQATSAPSNYYAQQSFVAQATGQPLALSAPPLQAQYYAMPTVVTANTMDVRLREVPSPPMPRIRIPGYDSSSTVPTIGSADGFRPRTSMR
jgi:hypothetical protein